MKRALLATIALFGFSPAFADVGRCPITADFITEPETIENVFPLAGAELRSTTKRSFVTGAMVSIECTEMDLSIVFPGASDQEILRNYLRFWSIQPLGDENGGLSEGADPVPHVILTGTKIIQGIEVIYSYRLFRFPSSFAMVAIGSPADTEDTRDVERFLSSIRIQKNENTVEDQQLFEIVRDGHITDLRRSMQAHQWSATDLSNALISAAGLNRPAEARLLLEAGADPNYQMLGSSVVVVATRENSVAVLELLLQNGGDPNLRVMFEWAPLHNAILTGGSQYQALETLLRSGAEIDARTSLQVTPLHRAAGFCDRRAVEILLAAGANPRLTEKYGRTAYQRSAEAGCTGIGGLSPP